MSKIIIELPEGCTRAGTLSLVNSLGVVVAGPFEVCGRADRQTASAKGNPACNPLRLYGDAPSGTFELIDIVETGPGSELDASNYGIHGAIRLKPVSGEASLAARGGRTGLMIHGGELSREGFLRPTSGCFRLSNQDMRALLEAIAVLAIADSAPSAVTVLVRDSWAGGAPVGTDEGYGEPDPPPRMGGNWHLAALWQTHDAEPQELARMGAVETTGSREGVQHEREGHEREMHDRDAPHNQAPAPHNRAPDPHNRAPEPPHDRDSHDREMPPHDRDVHDRDAHRDLASHDRDPNSHDRDSHDRDL